MYVCVRWFGGLGHITQHTQQAVELRQHLTVASTGSIHKSAQQMNMAFNGFIIIIILVLSGVLNITAGVNKNCGLADKSITNINKKDLFVSRGWGAGGSAYLESPYEPLRKALIRKPKTSSDQGRSRKMKSSQSGRNRQKNNNSNNIFGGAITQLFVSTGWGPNGRK
ncbi:PREDICTED: uncharacterized protein LOC108569489 [Nicrophorus vespilloides]|uniref:Uncharacterized protein LOC108569489 n=1 Tax=Nicrophorus vespilloides TaxID=110193 RepID=A0ABM1NI98_NICVS|nr:PREDICTED: uncharacterized protein LOC108569489 [Nicrophorus vespilloides]